MEKDQLSEFVYHNKAVASDFLNRILDLQGHSLIVTDLVNNITYGSISNGESVYVMEQSKDTHFIYVMSPSKHSMNVLFYTNDNMLCELDPVQPVQSSYHLPDGLKWNGECYKSHPYGFGRIFDNQRVVFEGFMINESKLYGREYASPHWYEGCWCYKQKTGFGTYTMDGHVEREEYLNRGEPLDGDGQSPSHCHSRMRCYAVPKNCAVEIQFLHFDWMATLERITIGSNSLQKTRKLEISCPRLKSIMIGKCCFSSEANDQIVKIHDCPHLESFSVERHSFVFFEQFIIFNLPHLEHLTLGNHFCMIGHSFYCRSTTLCELSSRSPIVRDNLARGQGFSGDSQSSPRKCCSNTP